MKRGIIVFRPQVLTSLYLKYHTRCTVMIRWRLIFAGLLFLFLLYIVMPFGAQRISAQTGVTPTLFCLSGEPCGPSDNPNPMSPVPPVSPFVPSAIVPSISGTTTPPPCITNTTVRGSNHRHHDGLLSEGGGGLIKLFLELLLFILQLFVGNPGIVGNSTAPVALTGAPSDGIQGNAPASPCPPVGGVAPSNDAAGAASPTGDSASAPVPPSSDSPSPSSDASGSTSCTKTVENGSSISDAVGGAQAGDTICVKGGNYAEEVNITSSGSDGKPITLKNAESTLPVVTHLDISGSYINVLGFEVTGDSNPLVQIEQGATNVTFKDGKIHDGPGNGVKTYGNYVTFENNDLTAFGNEDAFRIWGDNLTFRNNHIHDIQNPGHNDIWQTYQTDTKIPVTNLLLEGNTIENNTGGNAHCLMLESDGSNNFTVKNNTFTNIGSHCFILGKPGESGVANVQFENNTFNQIGGNAIECQGQTSGTITGNTFNGVGGQNVNNASGQCTVN